MNNMDSDKITLSTPSKEFAFEKCSRDIDNCNDPKILKEALRCYIKLYLKQQETLKSLGPMPQCK